VEQEIIERSRELWNLLELAEAGTFWKTRVDPVECSPLDSKQIKNQANVASLNARSFQLLASNLTTSSEQVSLVQCCSKREAWPVRLRSR
jgi:hypothetical protein